MKNNQLLLQTSSVIVSFMTWVLLSSLISFISTDLGLQSGSIAMLVAIPVVLGSLMRIPIGLWTNRYGARKIFTIGMFFLVLPVWYISTADTFTDLAIGGSFLGIAGSLFSIGVTSLPKYYPKERHGLINGLYALGNIGTAITAFGAPILANAMGWRFSVQLYIPLLIAVGLLNLAAGDKKENTSKASVNKQFVAVRGNSKLWILCLFYFLTFGSFVTFTVFMPNFLVKSYEISKVNAGLLTAIFISIATFIRPIGGWLGDNFNPFKILKLVFLVYIVLGVSLAFASQMELFLGISYCIGVFAGIANGVVFKLVPQYFSKQSGIVNGLVAAVGGLGGFFPPLFLTYVFKATGSYSMAFITLALLGAVNLIIARGLHRKEESVTTALT